MWNIKDICTFIVLFFFVDIIVAKPQPKLIITPQNNVEIGQIVTFSCQFNITDVYVISMHMDNTILVMWEDGQGYQTVKEGFITTDFLGDSTEFNVRKNVSLCDQKKSYFCRVYDKKFVSGDSPLTEVQFVKPQVKTSLDQDNPTIMIKNITKPNSYDFTCKFNKVRNGESIIVTSKNRSLIISDIDSSVNPNEEQCSSSGSYTSKLSFTDYGHYVIKCTVATNDTDYYSPSLEYSHTVDIVDANIIQLTTPKETDSPSTNPKSHSTQASAIIINEITEISTANETITINITPKERKEKTEEESGLAAWEVALIVLFCLILSILLTVAVIYLYTKKGFRRVSMSPRKRQSNKEEIVSHQMLSSTSNDA